MNERGVLTALAAAMALCGSSFAEYRPLAPTAKPYKRSKHGCTRAGWRHGTPMIEGGKLAKRLKRGKLLWRP